MKTLELLKDSLKKLEKEKLGCETKDGKNVITFINAVMTWN
jgi:hypothetical protein